MASRTKEIRYLDVCCTYTWEIHEFHKCALYEAGGKLSTTFVFEGVQHKLEIMRTATDTCKGTSFCLTTDLKSNDSRIYFSMAIPTKYRDEFVREGKVGYKTAHGFCIFSDDFMNDIIINDCVTIQLEFAYRRRRTRESCISQEREHAGLDRLSMDFASLYLNKLQADARIRVDGTDIEVHSQILSARSPVFAALFQAGIAECKSRVIEEKGIDICAMSNLLRYIYTGSLELKGFSAAMVVDIYTAAEKYHVRGLKELCSRRMMVTLSEENLRRYVEVALLHKDQKLINFMINFIKNSSYIIEGEDWKKVIDNFPDFGTKVLSDISGLCCPEVRSQGIEGAVLTSYDVDFGGRESPVPRGGGFSASTPRTSPNRTDIIEGEAWKRLRKP